MKELNLNFFLSFKKKHVILLDFHNPTHTPPRLKNIVQINEGLLCSFIDSAVKKI